MPYPVEFSFTRCVVAPLHKKIVYVDYGIQTQNNKYVINVYLLDINKNVLYNYSAPYNNVNDALRCSTKKIIIDHFVRNLINKI